ncbi:hypothetical protein [Blastococcus sp. SYSU D00820]
MRPVLYLKKALVVAAVAGSLTGIAACGDNSDLDRGTTECGSAEDNANCEDSEDAPTQGG